MKCWIRACVILALLAIGAAWSIGCSPLKCEAPQERQLTGVWPAVWPAVWLDEHGSTWAGGTVETRAVK